MAGEGHQCAAAAAQQAGRRYRQANGIRLVRATVAPQDNVQRGTLIRNNPVGHARLCSQKIVRNAHASMGMKITRRHTQKSKRTVVPPVEDVPTKHAEITRRYVKSACTEGQGRWQLRTYYMSQQKAWFKDRAAAIGRRSFSHEEPEYIYASQKIYSERDSNSAMAGNEEGRRAK